MPSIPIESTEPSAICGHKKRRICENHNLCDRCCTCASQAHVQRHIPERNASNNDNYSEGKVSSVYSEACRLSLADPICVAAKRVESILSDSDIRSLKKDQSRLVKKSVSNIMEHAIEDLAPTDPAGLFQMISPELQKKFDVEEDNAHHSNQLEKLIELAAVIVATLSRQSIESKTVISLFALSGRALTNRLTDKVSWLQREEQKRDMANQGNHDVLLN